MRARVVLGFAALLLCACDSAERRNAETVLAAISRFRTADNASTPAMVDALKATPCTAPDVCRTRDVCASSGDKTARALRLKTEVETTLASVEKGALSKDSPQALALPAKLDEAEKLLREGHDELPGCDQEVLSLKRKHRI